MEILPEEAERLAVVDIRHVHVNHHTHGQVVHVLVRVLINIHVVEPVIVVVVERRVTANILLVLVRQTILGVVVLVYVTVVSNIHVAELM